MKISGSNQNTLWHKNTKVKSKGGLSFSNNMDMTNQQQSRHQLHEMINKIKGAGTRLKNQLTQLHIQDYKNTIKEYLAFVLKNYHILKRERSIDYSTLYTRIEIIDKEIEMLTNELLNDQLETLAIIAKIDEIEGLLLDIYR